MENYVVAEWRRLYPNGHVLQGLCIIPDPKDEFAAQITCDGVVVAEVTWARGHVKPWKLHHYWGRALAFATLERLFTGAWVTGAPANAARIKARCHSRP